MLARQLTAQTNVPPSTEDPSQDTNRLPLPNEMILQIFSYLSVRDVVAVREVSRNFYAVSQLQWHQLYATYFPKWIHAVMGKPEIDWRAEFIEVYNFGTVKKELVSYLDTRISESEYRGSFSMFRLGRSRSEKVRAATCLLRVINKECSKDELRKYPHDLGQGQLGQIYSHYQAIAAIRLPQRQHDLVSKRPESDQGCFKSRRP